MATITLDYFATSDSVPLSVIAARAQQANLFVGELDLLGYTLIDRVVAIVGSDVRTRIRLSTNATSDSRFPTDAQRIYSTKNLYRAALADQIPAFVTAADPVVT